MKYKEREVDELACTLRNPVLKHSLHTVNKQATSVPMPIWGHAHLANNEKILSLGHAILDRGPNALSHLGLVLVDKRSINVPVTRWDGRFHRLCDLARGRLTDKGWSVIVIHKSASSIHQHWLEKTLAASPLSSRHTTITPREALACVVTVY